MGFKYKRPFLKLLFSGLLLAVGCVSSFGQTQKHELFTSVPESLRAGLTERLKLLVEYRSKKEWEKEYELLSFLTVHDRSKESYARISNNWFTNVAPDDLILGFVVTGTVSRGPLGWTIYGCAKLRKKNRSVHLRASVDAYREKDDWYFSEIGIVTPIDGKPTSCESSKKSQICISPTETGGEDRVKGASQGLK